MDFTYSDEAEAFRREFRAWLQANLPPRPEHREEGSEFGAGNDESWGYHLAWHKKMHAGGWVGVSWPREYGGRGATLEQQVVYGEETARAHSPALVNMLGISLVGPTLIHWGTEEQKKRYLKNILTADEVWCQGFSEPNAGSDLAALKTRAEVHGDDFVVNGQKVWTSWARYADWCMLLVRTDPEAAKHKGITFLLVDMRSPGITIRPLKQINGDDDFNEVFFEDVRVPRANVIGEVNQGWDIAITCLMHERQTLTFNRQLQSSIALTEMLESARRLQIDGAPVTEHPVLRQKLAAAFIDSHAMRYTAYRNLTKALRGEVPGPEGSIEKLFWSEMYQRQLETSLEIEGPYCQLLEGSAHAVDEGKWPFLFLYSRGRTIAAGSSEIQRNIIAERVLGLPRQK